MPAVLAMAGIAFLVTAAVPTMGSQPPASSQVHGFGVFTDDQLETVNEIRPHKAEATTDGLPRLNPSPPVIREAAPVDALPVTRAQPVSGGLSRPGAPRTSDSGPIQVAIASNLDEPLLVSQAIAALGADPGLRVVETNLAALERPDVLLILDRSTTGASVWYCGPSPNESSTLAAALLPQTIALGQEPDEAIGSAVDASLSCPTLHAGRARMAAVNLRLPVDEAPIVDLARAVTEGVRGYLEQSEARIQRNRTSNEVTWPAYGPLTSHYGPDHTLGIDIGQSQGDIVSATDGFVTFAGGDPCCSYGLYVIVESPTGITTLYGHLDAHYVKEGDAVRAGQPLGPVGNTGHSSGTHLHFETLVDGVRVNPLSVLP